MFTTIRQSLSGYKAYIVGVLGIALGIYTKDNEMILTGFGIITIRAGVAKTNTA